MSKQSVSLVEFSELYNILYEIKDLFNFDIFDYQKSKDFMLETESNNTECINSIIIINKKNNILFSNDKINRHNILLINELPISVEKLLDKIPAQLIKQKYNFQSNFNIKDYLLNLNSRVISKKKNELKLTEKEIDIILFLNNKKTPQSVVSLENEVWGHSFQLETHTVETHVYRLRKKIKNKFNDENFIISYEEGYKI